MFKHKRHFRLFRSIINSVARKTRTHSRGASDDLVFVGHNISMYRDVLKILLPTNETYHDSLIALYECY